MDNRVKLAAAALGGIVATLAAGGIAMASMDKGLGRFGPADANSDGQVTRAEWLGAANARFLTLDANKDGKLVGSELPRPRHGHGHGGRGEHAFERHGYSGPDVAPPPSAAPAPAVANTTG